MVKFSPSTKQFYIGAAPAPADCVEVSEQTHNAVIAARDAGKIIGANENGQPTISEPPAPVTPTAAEILAAERANMVVSRFQARVALHNADILASAESAIADADTLAQMAWQDAQEFRRNSPTVAAIAGSLGLTDTQLDDLFRQAATIEA